MLDLKAKSRDDVFVNCKIEHFPGHKQLVIADTPIFKYPAWEAREKHIGTSKPQCPNNEPLGRSINRARKRVHDIALLNDFQYFVTLTLNRKLIERENPRIVARILKTYLSNKVKRNNLSYLIVPELHADRKGIHMHGLVSGNIKLVDSCKKTKDGKSIYNMPEWTYGFSTCILLDGDQEAIARYIAKYISKDFRKIFGNFYYAGGGVKRIPPATYKNVDYDAFEVNPYYVQELGVNFKYVTIKEV